MSELALVYYPGHLGREPVSVLRDGHRAVRWNRPVRAMPAPDAGDLVRLGGFHLALAIEAASTRFGLPVSAIEELAEAGSVTLSQYEPPGGEPFAVVALDQSTTRALRATARAPIKKTPSRRRRSAAKEE